MDLKKYHDQTSKKKIKKMDLHLDFVRGTVQLGDLIGHLNGHVQGEFSESEDAKTHMTKDLFLYVVYDMDGGGCLQPICVFM